jgi:hypothetical protein
MVAEPALIAGADLVALVGEAIILMLGSASQTIPLAAMTVAGLIL